MRQLRVRVAFGVLLAAFVLAAGLLLRAEPPQTVGTWASLGTTPESRVGAAAVALPDGRTLIAGGSIAGAATDSVVVFDPADGSFASTGHLLLPRVGHTATLLDDGRVLIAGGTAGDLLSADLELFDPSSGTSVLGGAMAQPRTGHAAAKLANGSVLIAGGTGTDGVLQTAEIYDPATGTTSPTAVPMLSPRTGASATTLIDGRVLIAGGNNGTEDLASAEVFEASSQIFEAATTSLSVPRSGHAAVLLPWNNSVLIAGGSSNGIAQTTSDLFLPAEFPDPYSYGMGSFAPTGSLIAPRSGAVASPHVEGYAVAIGGGAPQAEVYRFATIKTDKDDYAPGTKAIITGSGWEPNADVTLVFQEDPAVHDDYILHVTSKSDGTIYWDQWAPEQHDLNVRFYLMAKQATTGGERRAQTTFTDAESYTASWTESTLTIAATAASLNSNKCYRFVFRDPTGTIHLTSAAHPGSAGNFTENDVLTAPYRTGTWTVRSQVDNGNATCTTPSFTDDTTVNVTVTASSPKLVFTAIPPATNAGTESGQWTVQRQNGAGVAYFSGSALTVTLASSSVSGTKQFRATSGGSATTSISIGATSSTGTFFYFDGTAGTYTITGSATVPVHTSASTSYTVNAVGPTKLAFTNVAFSGAVNACLGPLVVQSENSSNAVTNVTSTTTVNLSTNQSGTFYSDVACSTTITARTISNGTSTTGNFYYKPTAVGGGTHTLTGADNAAVLTSATQAQTVTKATPTVTFGAAPTPTYLGGNFTVSASTTNTDSSTLTYSVVSGPCALVSGATFSSSGAGTCVVQASGAATTNFNTASNTQDVTIAKATPTVTFVAAPTPTYLGGNFTVSASTTNTDSSTLTYSRVSGPCAPVSGATFSSSGAGTCRVQASGAATTNFNSASNTQDVTIAKATPTATLAVTNSPQTYTGSGLAATVEITASSVPGAVANILTGGLATQTTAGPYAVTADFVPTDTTNYNSLLGVSAGNFVIAKATPTATLAVTNSPQTYTGSGLAATVEITASSVPGAVANILTGGLATQTTAGPYAVTANFVPTDTTNYNSLLGVSAGNFVIAKASSTTTTVGAGPFTYDTTTHSGGSGTVTGIGGLSTSATSVTYTGDQVNAGTYYVTAHYAGDANHFGSDGNPVGIDITKASSTTTTVGAGPFTYDTTTHSGGSGTVTGIGGLSTSATSLSYTGDQVNAGTYYVTAHYAGDANHFGSDGDPVGIDITKASSTTTTVGAGPFVYTGSTQTGGSGTVTGAGVITGSATVTYTGDQINVGTYYVTAHYAGDANHFGSDGNPVGIDITKASSTTTTVGAGPFVYTGGTQTGGSGTVTGAGVITGSATVTYTGDQINVGTYYVTAHYAGDANHFGSDGNPVGIDITKASSTTTTVGAGPFVYTGSTQTGGSGTVTGAGVITGSATVTYTGDQINVGTYYVTAHYAGDANHFGSDGNPVGIDITKASSTTTTVGAGPFAYDGTTHTGGSGTVTGAGGLSTSATSVTYTGDQVNAGTYYVTAHYAGDANHFGSDGDPVGIDITKASSTTTTVGAGPFVYTGSTQTGGSGTVTGAGVITGSATVTYTGDQINVGTYYVTAHYAGDANHFGSDGNPVGIDITKASSTTTTVGAGPFVYTGSTQTGGSGTVTGAGVITGSATVTYTGDQINVGTYYVTAHYAGDANHFGSDGNPVAIDITKASSTTTTVGAGPFTYDTTTHSGGSGTVTGIGGLSTSATSVTYAGDQVNAGTYYVTAHYAGDANHFGSDGNPVGIDITKASSTTTTVGAGPFTYDGTTHTGGSGTVTGIGGLSTSATSLSYTGDQINAGTYYVTAHYAGDANHDPSDGLAVGIVINKAASTTTTVGDGPFTYDTTTHSGGSGTVTGIGGLSTSATSLSYTGDQINAGTYYVTAHYAGDANHEASDGLAVGIVINKVASTTTTVGDGPFTYDGTTHTGGSGTVTGAGGLSTSATSLTYTGDQVNVGTYYVTAHYTGDANHDPSDGLAVGIVTNKAASTTTTVGAGPFTYDTTTHSGGSGTVAGAGVITGSATLTYTGDQVNAGTYYVTAHYAGDANHDPSDGAAVGIVINKAASTTTTVGAGPFTYDTTTHSGGSGTVTGIGGLSTSATSLSYTGDQIIAGTYYVTAHYAGDANHDPSDGLAVAIVINKAASTTTTVGDGPFTYSGSTQTGGSGTVAGAGVISGSATLTYSGNQVNVGTYYVTAHYAGDANHFGSDGAAVGIDITKAASTTTTVGAGPFVYTGSTQTGGSGTVAGAGVITGSATLTYSGNQVNVGTYYVTAHYAGDANHFGSDGAAVGVEIKKANATVVVAPYTVTYNGSPHTATVTSITGVGGQTGVTVGSVNVSATTHTNPGTYNGDAWTLTGTANYNNTSGTVNDLISYGTCSAGYGPGGVILAPVNSDGTSVFNRKGGSTIPVKFRLCDASGNPITNPAAVFGVSSGSITLLSAVRGTVSVVNESTLADIPDVAFRLSGDQWIFNMATTNLDAGSTYTFRINLALGSIQFQVGVK